jgi:hypothetical protein
MSLDKARWCKLREKKDLILNMQKTVVMLNGQTPKLWLLQGEDLKYIDELNKLRSVATTDDNFQKDIVN